MFLLAQRTDLIPEMRVLVNTDFVVAAMPVIGGAKTRLYLSTGETWEIALPFPRAINLFRGEETPPPAPDPEPERRQA